MNEQQCRALVFARASGRCERCGGLGITLHHRKKRSQGGLWCPSNIVALCGHGTKGCHGWVESFPNKAEAEGLHVRPWDDPEEIPVKFNRTEWYLLLPDGGTLESDPREEDEPEGGGIPDEVPGEGWIRREDWPPDL